MVRTPLRGEARRSRSRCLLLLSTSAMVERKVLWKSLEGRTSGSSSQELGLRMKIDCPMKATRLKGPLSGR